MYVHAYECVAAFKLATGFSTLKILIINERNCFFINNRWLNSQQQCMTTFINKWPIIENL